MSAVLVTVAFPALLALAAGWDLASYTIPNRFSLALFGTFLLFFAVSGLPLSQLGFHLAAFALALVIGFAFFAARFIGGGDAKLFAATALWFGFADLPAYAVMAALFGGVLTLSILLLRQVPLPEGLSRQAWAVRLHCATSGIPYGVALAAGALWVLPHSRIFHLVTNA